MARRRRTRPGPAARRRKADGAAASRAPKPPTTPRATTARPAQARGRRWTRPSPGLVLGLGAVAVVAIAVGVALSTGFLSPPTGPGRLAPAATVRTLPISGVGAVAVGDGQAWVDLPGRELLERLEPASGRVVGRPVHLAGSLGALAIADRRVFVADRSAGTVLCLSATTGRQIGQPVPVGGEPVSLVTAGGLVWAASLASGTVTAIDPTTVSALTAAALPDGAVRLAAGAGAVWATGQQDQLARIDPHPLAAGLAVRTTDVGTGPIGVAVGDGAVFTANLAGEAVSRVDPASLRVTATFPFGRAAAGPADAPGAGPASVAVDGDRLFVASYGEPEVSVLSARTGQPVGQPVAVPGPVTALETVGSQVWAVTANPDRLVVLSPA